jgi:hypothetical protein
MNGLTRLPRTRAYACGMLKAVENGFDPAKTMFARQNTSSAAAFDKWLNTVATRHVPESKTARKQKGPTPLFAETLRWTNVRDYGAECNGNYDDTSAFSRGDRRSPIGGDVFVPPGNAS